MRKSRQVLVIIFLISVFTSLLYYAYLEGLWPDRGFICPISYNNGNILIRNDSMGEGHFGAKRRGGRKHKGVDLSASVGTPVRAARTGQVIETGNHPGGYGKYVEIRHPDGFVTIYAHLSEIDVGEGRIVYRGRVIGKVGRSGNASYRLIKPHLHFEIIKDGVPVDPMEYIIK
jgi:murein DD-endopeptidase MepM/ murein hydrolase activator NlpD